MSRSKTADARTKHRFAMVRNRGVMLHSLKGMIGATGRHLNITHLFRPWHARCTRLASAGGPPKPPGGGLEASRRDARAHRTGDAGYLRGPPTSSAWSNPLADDQSLHDHQRAGPPTTLDCQH